MAAATLHQVVLYARAGCHLCDVARRTILTVRSLHPFDLVEVDIGSRDDLLRDYGVRIPVVEIDGDEVFEVEVPEARFTALVRR